MSSKSENLKPDAISHSWEQLKIGKFAKTVAGGTPSTTNPSYWNGDIRWMNSGELNHKMVYEVENRITELGLRNSSTSLLPLDCVLIGLAGQGKTRGTVAINKVQLCTNQSIAAILPNDKTLPLYLYYNLDSRYEELRRLSTGDGGRGGLNLSIINGIKIPIPPKEEQKAIANCLSTWDDAIEKQTKLIAAKQQRKKALMQQLLSGKKRLPGFTETWKNYTLGSLGSTFNGLTGKNKEDFGEGQPFITYLNIFQNPVIDISTFDLVKINLGERQNRVKYGDIFFTVSSETQDEVGMASVLLQDVEDLYLNSFCFGYRLHNFDTLLPEFSSYFFRAYNFRKELFKLSQGATRYNLSKNNLMLVEISVPNVKEQKLISDILFTAEKEISAEKIRLVNLSDKRKH